MNCRLHQSQNRPAFEMAKNLVKRTSSVLEPYLEIVGAIHPPSHPHSPSIAHPHSPSITPPFTLHHTPIHPPSHTHSPSITPPFTLHHTPPFTLHHTPIHPPSHTHSPSITPPFTLHHTPPFILHHTPIHPPSHPHSPFITSPFTLHHTPIHPPSHTPIHSPSHPHSPSITHPFTLHHIPIHPSSHTPTHPLSPFCQFLNNSLLQSTDSKDRGLLVKRVYDVIHALYTIAPSTLNNVLPQLEFKLKVVSLVVRPHSSMLPLCFYGFASHVCCSSMLHHLLCILLHLPQSISDEDRIAACRLLCRLFSTPNNTLAQQYKALWNAFLTRFLFHTPSLLHPISLPSTFFYPSSFSVFH